MHREPLVHFAVLGAVVFAAGAWLRPGEDPSKATVSADAVQALVRAHEQRLGRPATADERLALAEQAADDEVLYREAVALGLDQGDPVIRKRLVEKMRLLALAGADVAEPTAEELAAYRVAHAERYVAVPSVSLTHVFVRAESRAAAILARLRSGSAPSGLGDPFPHGGVLRSRTEAMLAGVFGPAFARAAMSLAPGEWAGPLGSSFGHHLVRIDAREDGAPAQGDAVRRDLAEERRRAAGAIALQRLRQRYVMEAP